MRGQAAPGNPRKMVVVSVAFWAEDYPTGHLPLNECWESCVVTVRKKDNPGRPIRPTKSPIPATRLADLPRAVEQALSDAGVTIHKVRTSPRAHASSRTTDSTSGLAESLRARLDSNK